MNRREATIQTMLTDTLMETEFSPLGPQVGLHNHSNMQIGQALVANIPIPVDSELMEGIESFGALGAYIDEVNGAWVLNREKIASTQTYKKIRQKYLDQAHSQVEKARAELQMAQKIVSYYY